MKGFILKMKKVWRDEKKNSLSFPQVIHKPHRTKVSLRLNVFTNPQECREFFYPYRIAPAASKHILVEH